MTWSARQSEAARLCGMLDQLLQDLRFALRRLARARGDRHQVGLASSRLSDGAVNVMTMKPQADFSGDSGRGNNGLPRQFKLTLRGAF